MDKFYILNEWTHSKENKVGNPHTPSRAKYNADIDISIAFGIYVKAINNMISITERHNEELRKLDSNKEIDPEYSLKLTHDVNKIKSIAKEFKKVFAVVDDQDAEASSVGLYKLFTVIDLKANLWYLLREVKYGEEMIQAMHGILKILQHIAKPLNLQNTNP